MDLEHDKNSANHPDFIFEMRSSKHQHFQGYLYIYMTVNHAISN
jgi:hypothetical protein